MSLQIPSAIKITDLLFFLAGKWKNYWTNCLVCDRSDQCHLFIYSHNNLQNLDTDWGARSFCRFLTGFLRVTSLQRTNKICSSFGQGEPLPFKVRLYCLTWLIRVVLELTLPVWVAPQKPSYQSACFSSFYVESELKPTKSLAFFSKSASENTFLVVSGESSCFWQNLFQCLSVCCL